MKKYFDHLFFTNYKCKFVRKESEKQTSKKQSFTSIFIVIVLALCLIAVRSLYAARQQTTNDTGICQFVLISLEVSARLLYSDLERKFQEDPEKRKFQKNFPVATYLWITLEVLILCTICVAISYILVQQAPHSSFTHLKTLAG